MRAAEAMAKAGLNVQGAAIEEGWLKAQCPECETVQKLDSAETRDNGQQTEYLCDSCEAVFVIVGPAPGLTGYRLGDHVVHTRGGLWLHPPGTAADVYMPPPDESSVEPEQ